MADKLHINAANAVVFHCPACGHGHLVRVEPTTGVGGVGGPGRWGWNRSLDRPSFYPSLMIYGGKRSTRCHSIVRDGMIQYLNDCTHALAGQTVEIPDWE